MKERDNASQAVVRRAWDEKTQGIALGSTTMTPTDRPDTTMQLDDAAHTFRIDASLGDLMVLRSELSVSAGAKLADMPYARYLQHLGTLGYSLLDESVDMSAELATLQNHVTLK
jgi:hypothetical protein